VVVQVPDSAGQAGHPRCRLADCGLVAGPYENLAADYDWIFGDDELAHGAAIRRPAAARLFERISRASMVLDAACGTGIDAAALARRGFRVWAADASEAMAGRRPGSGQSGWRSRCCGASGRIFPLPPASVLTLCCASGTR